MGVGRTVGLHGGHGQRPGGEGGQTRIGTEKGLGPPWASPLLPAPWTQCPRTPCGLGVLSGITHGFIWKVVLFKELLHEQLSAGDRGAWGPRLPSPPEQQDRAKKYRGRRWNTGTCKEPGERRKETGPLLDIP